MREWLLLCFVFAPGLEICACYLYFSTTAPVVVLSQRGLSIISTDGVALSVSAIATREFSGNMRPVSIQPKLTPENMSRRNMDVATTQKDIKLQIKHSHEFLPTIDK